ncbi:MAG: beta-ketoacyl synthase N-terminal-like domain-containing protein [Saprospiraceae bacterium]
MISADEAIADAGISVENIDPLKIGVIVGSGIGGLRSLEKKLRNLRRVMVSPDTIRL